MQRNQSPGPRSVHISLTGQILWRLPSRASPEACLRKGEAGVVVRATSNVEVDPLIDGRWISVRIPSRGLAFSEDISKRRKLQIPVLEFKVSLPSAFMSHDAGKPPFVCTALLSFSPPLFSNDEVMDRQLRRIPISRRRLVVRVSATDRHYRRDWVWATRSHSCPSE